MVLLCLYQEKSLEIMKKTNYQGKRLQDSEIFKHIENKEMIRFVGKKDLI